MHLLVELCEGDDIELAVRAEAAGLAVQPLSKWYLEGNHWCGLMLGFTNITSPEQASQLVGRLARVLQWGSPE